MKKSKEAMFNPALMFGIGLFPLVVVSTTLKMALVYGVLLFLVLALSYLIVGSFKVIIPHRVRLICYALSILSCVYLLDSALYELFPKDYQTLHGLVVYLLASSIIIYLLEVGSKAESFGYGFKKVSYLGLEYVITMIVVGIIREFLGFGTIWGMTVVDNFKGFEFFIGLAGGITIVLVLALIYNSVAYIVKKRVKTYNILVKRYSAVIDKNVTLPDFDEEDNESEKLDTESEVE